MHLLAISLFFNAPKSRKIFFVSPSNIFQSTAHPPASAHWNPAWSKSSPGNHDIWQDHPDSRWYRHPILRSILRAKSLSKSSDSKIYGFHMIYNWFTKCAFRWRKRKHLQMASTPEPWPSSFFFVLLHHRFWTSISHNWPAIPGRGTFQHSHEFLFESAVHFCEATKCHRSNLGIVDPHNAYAESEIASEKDLNK